MPPRPTASAARCRCSTASGWKWRARSPPIRACCCSTRSPAGSPQGECDELVETIRGIHRSGRTIVWIEHIVNALVAVVGRLVVLNFGRLIAEGEPQAVLASPQVREIYLGSPV